MDSQLVEDLEFTVDVQFPNVRGLHAALLAIKSPNKQFCTVSFAAAGMTVTWEDDSKTMQSGVHLRNELFSAYSLVRPTTFSLPFHTLLDTLAVFTTSTLAEQLVMRYPGPDAELLLEAIDDIEPLDGNPNGSAAAACTYARLDTVERPPFDDLVRHWQDPTSYFIESAGLLKEAVDDLEWTKGDVELRLQRDPPRLGLTSAHQALALDVDIPPERLSALSCAAPEVRHAYAHKLLRTAFAHLPAAPRDGAAGTSTKVSLDARGLMKVTHMLSLVPAGRDAPRAAVTHPLASAGGTQHAAAALRLGVAQFVLLPLAGDAGGEGGWGLGAG